MRLLDLWVRTPLAEALGWTLFQSLWEGVIIAAALGVVLAVVRSPRVRYATACAALLLLLAAFAATLIHLLPGGHGDPGTQSALPLADWAYPVDVQSGDTRLAWDALVSAAVPWLATFWVAGLCFFSLRYSAGWIASGRLQRRGVCWAPASWQAVTARLAGELKISRPVVLLESLLADTPMILGHLRPVILVPLGFLAGLPAPQVEAILLHELAHVRRADYLVNVCQRVVEALLFYHPAVWWISRLIRTERENCCDDIVVALGCDPHSYAAALTALEQNRLEQPWPKSEPALAATGGSLMKRVRRLLYPNGPGGIWAPPLAAVALIASATLALAAWQAKPNAGNAGSVAAAPASPETAWQKWLNEDVVYIITPEERAAFERLETDAERQHFVEQFWERRNPTPGSTKNAYKEEHDRRIAYANNRFASNKPGWETDRGRIYIMYGPPDEIESHPAAGSRFHSPYEEWLYHHIDGLGDRVIFTFIDQNGTRDFRLAPKKAE
jgi:GWxTD domain-containing protein